MTYVLRKLVAFVTLGEVHWFADLDQDALVKPRCTHYHYYLRLIVGSFPSFTIMVASKGWAD